jgi:hypothetical protein
MAETREGECYLTLVEALGDLVWRHGSVTLSYGADGWLVTPEAAVAAGGAPCETLDDAIAAAFGGADDDQAPEIAPADLGALWDDGPALA